ncbi:MAG: glycosyltransferase family 88 protein [Pseudomonadota bacterium]
MPINFFSCTLNELHEFDLQRHVKIWLSKRKDEFMSLTNQLRLIKARVTNPDDQISLVYDGRLLSDEAIASLHQFCQTHNIKPHDMKNLRHLVKTKEEKFLISMYEDEINNLENGGNLAAASDILRILSPVYSLGVYTDFDVAINTNNLGSMIFLKEPVLINCGILENQLYYASDIIAVSNSKAGENLMNLLQRTMIAKCTGKFSFIKPITSIDEDESLDHGQWHEKLLLESLHAKFSIRTFRFFIQQLHPEAIQDIIQKPLNFAELQKLDMRYKKQESKIVDTPSIVAERKREEMYIRSVVNTTGPTIYRLAFAPRGCWNTKNKCGSFAQLGLLSAFKGYIPGTRENNNDYSWLPRGVKNIAQSEEEMINNFKRVSKAYKNYKQKQERKKTQGLSL